MDKLADLHCNEVTRDTPRMNPKDIKYYLDQIEDWRLYEKDGEPHLEKAYSFRNFTAAMTFSHRVGQIADTENHHPAILTEWGKATVTWWTHRNKGLTLNDFIMAAKTEQIYKSIDTAAQA
jgi:4a-hydroxytetrahydrobiopterin dehydratase